MTDRWADMQTDWQTDDGEVISLCQPAYAGKESVYTYRNQMSTE